MQRRAGRVRGGTAVVVMAVLAACGDSIPVDPGAAPDARPVQAVGACGDNLLDPGEECDDGNGRDGDGCSAACAREACAAGRSVFHARDSYVQIGEANGQWRAYGDFGGDAALDYVTLDPTTGELVVEIQTAGAFAEAGRLTAAELDPAFWFGAAELDGGRDELFVETFGGVEERMAIVAFTAEGVPSVVASFAETYYPAACDLDGDGVGELVVADLQAGRVVAAHNDAGAFGSLEPLVPLVPEFGVTGILCEDVDGDGDVDLVPIGWDRSWVWRNEPTGFLPSPAAPVGQAQVLVDLDGDARPDLVGAAGLSFNQGDGTFAAPDVAVTGTAAGDVDGDGDLDLVGRGDAWRNDGGAFVKTRSDPFPSKTILVDPDGDGDLDLVSGGAMVENLGGGRFVAPAVGAFADPEVHLVDLGAASPPAIVAVSPGISIVIPDPSGVAERESIAGGRPPAVVADRDGDGDLDLTAATEEGFALFVNQTDGWGFSSIRVGETPTALVMANLDAGTTPDLAWTAGTFVATWFTGGAPIRHDTRHVLTAAAALDLDADGDLDLVATDAEGHLFPFANRWAQGDRSFAELPVVAIDRGAVAIATGDLDGDGRVDLAIAANSCSPGPCANAGLQILDNRPEGLVPRPSVFVPDFPTAIVAADLDGDRDVDLALAGPGGAELFENRGADPFVFTARWAPLLFPPDPFQPGHPWSVAAGAVDDDCMLDLVVGDADGAVRTWLTTTP